ncbi:MAG: hypothetical protein P4L16_05620 [Chlamydiales bacterium]|nr:hypothetical protein [Chlamydiales bacterium]
MSSNIGTSSSSLPVDKNYTTQQFALNVNNPITEQALKALGIIIERRKENSVDLRFPKEISIITTKNQASSSGKTSLTINHSVLGILGKIENDTTQNQNAVLTPEYDLDSLHEKYNWSDDFFSLIKKKGINTTKVNIVWYWLIDYYETNPTLKLPPEWKKDLFMMLANAYNWGLSSAEQVNLSPEGSPSALTLLDSFEENIVKTIQQHIENPPFTLSDFNSCIANRLIELDLSEFQRESAERIILSFVEEDNLVLGSTKISIDRPTLVAQIEEQWQVQQGIKYTFLAEEEKEIKGIQEKLDALKEQPTSKLKTTKASNLFKESLKIQAFQELACCLLLTNPVGLREISESSPQLTEWHIEALKTILHIPLNKPLPQLIQNYAKKLIQENLLKGDLSTIKKITIVHEAVFNNYKIISDYLDGDISSSQEQLKSIIIKKEGIEESDIEWLWVHVIAKYISPIDSETDSEEVTSAIRVDCLLNNIQQTPVATIHPFQINLSLSEEPSYSSTNISTSSFSLVQPIRTTLEERANSMIDSFFSIKAARSGAPCSCQDVARIFKFFSEKKLSQQKLLQAYLSFMANSPNSYVKKEGTCKWEKDIQYLTNIGAFKELTSEDQEILSLAQTTMLKSSTPESVPPSVPSPEEASLVDYSLLNTFTTYIQEGVDRVFKEALETASDPNNPLDPLEIDLLKEVIDTEADSIQDFLKNYKKGWDFDVNNYEVRHTALIEMLCTYLLQYEKKGHFSKNQEKIAIEALSFLLLYLEVEKNPKSINDLMQAQAIYRETLERILGNVSRMIFKEHWNDLFVDQIELNRFIENRIDCLMAIINFPEIQTRLPLATIITKLAEQENLSPEDALGKWISEFKLEMVKNHRTLNQIFDDLCKRLLNKELMPISIEAARDILIDKSNVSADDIKMFFQPSLPMPKPHSWEEYVLDTKAIIARMRYLQIYTQGSSAPEQLVPTIHEQALANLACCLLLKNNVGFEGTSADSSDLPPQHVTALKSILEIPDTDPLPKAVSEYAIELIRSSYNEIRNTSSTNLTFSEVATAFAINQAIFHNPRIVSSYLIDGDIDVSVKLLKDALGMRESEMDPLWRKAIAKYTALDRESFADLSEAVSKTRVLCLNFFKSDSEIISAIKLYFSPEAALLGAPSNIDDIEFIFITLAQLGYINQQSNTPFEEALLDAYLSHLILSSDSYELNADSTYKWQTSIRTLFQYICPKSIASLKGIKLAMVLGALPSARQALIKDALQDKLGTDWEAFKEVFDIMLLYPLSRPGDIYKFNHNTNQWEINSIPPEQSKALVNYLWDSDKSAFLLAIYKSNSELITFLQSVWIDIQIQKKQIDKTALLLQAEERYSDRLKEISEEPDFTDEDKEFLIRKEMLGSEEHVHKEYLRQTVLTQSCEALKKKKVLRELLSEYHPDRSKESSRLANAISTALRTLLP